MQRNDLLAATGRLLLAALFLFSGFGKLAAPEATLAYMGSVSLPAPLVGLVIAILVELGGGAMLLVGFRVRGTAITIAAYALATAIIFHHQVGDQNQLSHFLKNIAIAGGLLQVAAFGAGGFGVDARRHGRSADRATF